MPESVKEISLPVSPLAVHNPSERTGIVDENVCRSQSPDHRIRRSGERVLTLTAHVSRANRFPVNAMGASVKPSVGHLAKAAEYLAAKETAISAS